MKLDDVLVGRILATIEADKDPTKMLILRGSSFAYELLTQAKPGATPEYERALTELVVSVVRTLQQLRADGLVRDYSWLQGTKYPMQQLTWQGHDALDALRAKADARDEGPGV
jgi:hypothetical protein